MTWDSTDFAHTALLPIVGGIIAGLVVILLQWGYTSLHEWNQRRNAVNAVEDFFRKWENDITSTDELLTSDGRFTLPRGRLQFEKHKEYLRTVHILLDRWSKFLSGEQSEDIALFLARHEGAQIGIIPEESYPSQNSMTSSSVPPGQSNGWSSEPCGDP